MARTNGEPRIGRKRSLATAIVVARMRRDQSKYSSVLAFAKTLGISEGTYNLLVSGATNPTIDTLEKIAAGLGLTFYELIGNIDTETLRKRLTMVRLDHDAIVKSIERFDEAAAGFESAIAESEAPPKRKSTGAIKVTKANKRTASHR